MNYKKFLSKAIALSLAISSCAVFAPAVYALEEDNTEFVAIEDSASDAAQLTVTNNIDRGNYLAKSVPVYSYLNEEEDGQLTRVEYDNSSNKVIIEKLDVSGGKVNVTLSKKLDPELSMFGGCYFSADANYIVYAQEDREEDPAKEVFRVVKYDKDWKKIGSTSLMGANTTIPFRSGSLRMTEMNGKLYIHTCHQMFKTYDGNNHQANMTFVIDEATMKADQYFWDFLDIEVGYISHSFNQFIQNDGEYIYRVDHGDTYPRGISITKCPPDDITNVEYNTAYPINGKLMANNTGVSVGGFELSKDKCIIVGNTVDMSNASTYNADGQRNIFITVIGKDMKNPTTKVITNYSEGAVPYTPQLIKKDDDTFLLIWSVVNDNNVRSYYAILNGNGEVVGDIQSSDLRLSDCHPIVRKNGIVAWYVTDGSGFTLLQPNLFGVEIEEPNTPDTPDKPSVSDSYKELLTEITSDNELENIRYGLADIDGDCVPELIVTTPMGNSNVNNVSIYTYDNKANGVSKVLSISGETLDVRINIETGNLVLIQTTETSVNTNELKMKDGTIDPTQADMNFYLIEKGEHPDVTLSKNLPVKYLDYVEASRMGDNWASVKHVAANHEPALYEGLDLSLFEDYERSRFSMGNVNGDKLVDATDASDVLVEYGKLSTNKPGTFNEYQSNAGDVNGDGRIDASDASDILAYYSYVSTGGTDSMELYMMQKKAEANAKG